MRDTSPRGLRFSKATAACALAVLMLLPGLATRADAGEIPHENYDLIESNLDVVIALLNSSILYSEAALNSMYDEHMTSVDENLTVVRGILTPAEQLLGEIESIAGSYTNLSELLPPFANLSSEETSFAEMEASLLDVRSTIVTAAQLANLTGDQMLEALDAITRFNSLITGMNRTIDDMLVSANRIIALEIEGKQPFTHNDLIPLIERLRDLLRALQLEVDRIVREDISWKKASPFLLLWLDASEYHLGDIITGGGYLYYNGSFAANHLIFIMKDGVNYTSSLTSHGYYTFQRRIPVNASWLGQHTMEAFAYTPAGFLKSGEQPFEVLLVRTLISLSLSKTLISPPESVSGSVRLVTELGDRLGAMPCNLSVDGTMYPFTTGADGTFSTSWTGSNLGYGAHTFRAFFGGLLPYASASSGVRGVTVDIPTNISVELFTPRLRQDISIVGNGLLTANGSARLAGMNVTISVDGHVMANLTTNSEGVFSFSIPASSLAYGTHILRAEFLHRESIWRYSWAEAPFSVIPPKVGLYPFLPHIPGWGGINPDRIAPYLFFGTYSYLTWLLALALVLVTVKIYQARRRKARDRPMGEQYESLMPLEPELPSDASLAGMAAAGGFNLGSIAGAAPNSPNERIVWYYQSLLSFLARRRSVSGMKSMTHWEVARTLSALGFPFPHVERATILFERAYYSGAELTEDDSVEMSDALSHIVGAEKGGEASARAA